VGFGLFAAAKCAKVTPLTSLGIFPARVQPVLTRFQFTDHAALDAILAGQLNPSTAELGMPVPYEGGDIWPEFGNVNKRVASQTNTGIPELAGYKWLSCNPRA